MVTDLSGDVWLQNGPKQKRLSVLSYIEEGRSLRLDAKSSISITTFNPAAEYSITGPAKLEMTAGEVRVLEGGKLVKKSLDEQKAVAGRQFSAVQRDRLAMAAFRMRGASSENIGLSQLSPANVELLNVHPVFTWFAPQEAKKFIVTLFDETERKAVKEVTLNEPLWRLPSELSLKFQHQYSWEVRSMLASGQEIVSAGEFSIIDEARAKRIMQSKPKADAQFSERVLFAVLLEGEGLKTDATDEWKILAAERPNEPLIAVHMKNH
jgi:hypothetical protein